MIRQSFIYDEQSATLVPRPVDYSYQEMVAKERAAQEAERKRVESVEHPGVYL